MIKLNFTLILMALVACSNNAFSMQFLTDQPVAPGLNQGQPAPEDALPPEDAADEHAHKPTSAYSSVTKNSALIIGVAAAISYLIYKYFSDHKAQEFDAEQIINN